VAGLLEYNEDDMEMALIFINSTIPNQSNMLMNIGDYNNALSTITAGSETPKEAFDRVKGSLQAQVDEFNSY
jgi:hypothetical protein